MIQKKIKNLQQLRWIGFVEGLSFVILLLIAMPLKYFFDFPMAVKVNGWIHGILFIFYIWAVFRTAFLFSWNYKRTGIALVASLIPLATFVLDKGLKKEQLVLSDKSQTL